MVLISWEFKGHYTIIVLVEVVDLVPAIVADDINDGFAVERPHVDDEVLLLPGMTDCSGRGDVGHVERVRERLHCVVGPGSMETKQHHDTICHHRTHCNKHSSATSNSLSQSTLVCPISMLSRSTAGIFIATTDSTSDSLHQRRRLEVFISSVTQSMSENTDVSHPHSFTEHTDEKLFAIASENNGFPH